MEITLLVLKIIVIIVLIIFIGCIIPSAVEVYRILKDFRAITNRVEILTDFKGWFDFFRKIHRKKKQD